MLPPETSPETPRRWRAALLDALLPPRCLACPASVDQPGRLCPRCWTGIDFITPPNCAVCGFPFDVDEGPESQEPPAGSPLPSGEEGCRLWLGRR